MCLTCTLEGTSSAIQTVHQNHINNKNDIQIPQAHMANLMPYAPHLKHAVLAPFKGTRGCLEEESTTGCAVYQV